MNRRKIFQKRIAEILGDAMLSCLVTEDHWLPDGNYVAYIRVKPGSNTLEIANKLENELKPHKNQQNELFVINRIKIKEEFWIDFKTIK